MLAGALITLGGVASVFAVCAGLDVVAALLVARLQVAPLAPPPEHAPALLASLGESLRLAVGRPRLRLMLALLTAEAAVVGALDLLFVILAVAVLGRTRAWAGYLNAAYGAGAVLAARAAPRSSRVPAWPAATPSGSAYSTRPARKTTYGESSSTSLAHRPLRPRREAPESLPIPETAP